MQKMQGLGMFIGHLPGNEMVRYGISGGIIALVNMMGYFLLLEAGTAYAAANIISLAAAKMAGYFLNKFWVYHSVCRNWKRAAAEFLRYIAARGFTGLVDFFGVMILVEWAGLDERVSKILLMAAVVVLNYILGRKAVFTAGKERDS